jgi:hypothetical protein
MNKVTYNNDQLRVGQFYKNKTDSQLYLATQLTHKDGSTQYVLACIDDGNIWENPTEDIGDIFGSKYHFGSTDFELIVGTFTITTDGN